jgi:mannitol-1-phosphate 5-dehydrogenase
VDRIVPVQAEGAGLDVTVEDFHEWAVERGPFEGTEPEVPGITWVDSLGPYIERKLFTVNTGHATTAWHGARTGHATIAESIADPEVAEQVTAVLEETSSLLVAKHGFAEEEMASYRTKVLGRFANTALPDPVERVGRAPLRKLSREDRIIGPAAELAERGLGHEALLDALSAALVFTPEGDEEVDRLQEILASSDPDAATAEITGLEPAHPLYTEVRARIASPVYSRHTD